MNAVVDELDGDVGTCGRHRSRRRRAGLLVAAALLLTALASACAGPPESISTGSPGRPGGSSFGTPVPRPTAPTAPNPLATSTTLAPSDLAPTPSTAPQTTTTAAPISREITSDGVLGVPFGIPMDEAVRRISTQLGYPDDDSQQETRCERHVTRQVSWGPLAIVEGPQPDDDRFRGIVYRADLERSGSGRKLGVLIGGMPLVDTRPQAELEAALQAAVTGSTDAGYSAKDVYTVTSPDRRLDAFLGNDAPVASNVVGVMLSDRADPIVC